MKNIFSLIYILLMLAPAILFTDCRNSSKEWEIMDEAENLMETHPDSALALLSEIDTDKLGNSEEKARYALSMSMALDKNYVDTTNFDILQPAIDYYLNHGTTEEKLRTLYYQGRIYQNDQNFDMAMRTFLKAKDMCKHSKDTLTYARLLVAQGKICMDSYQTEDYMSNNLQAAELYGGIGKSELKLMALHKVLNGCIIIDNKSRADSVMPIIDSLLTLHPERHEDIVPLKISYTVYFGSSEDVHRLLDSITDSDLVNDEIKYSVIAAYQKIKQPEKAYSIFNTIDSINLGSDIYKYLITKVNLLEEIGNYKEAFSTFKSYYEATEHENVTIYSQKTDVADELHKIEVDNLNSIQSRDRAISISICVLLLVSLGYVYLYYRSRMGKAKRALTEKENDRLKLEAKSHALERENLEFRISHLEDEREKLQQLLTENNLSKPISGVILDRVKILNGLIASNISSNRTYSKQYENLISQINEDKEKFIKSNRIAFMDIYPKFMQHLIDRGLTENELDYACLFALGLKGKEIGKYLNTSNHYHISSDIRAKLALNDKDTNLSIHIRELLKQYS